jgi:hypothetical protein
MKMTNMLRTKLLACAFACVTLITAGCGSGVTGTYSDPTGAFVLNLNSGGNATIAFAGMSSMCTYTVSGSNVTLMCQGDTSGPLVLTIQSDGSVTGPPGSFMPPLKKK